MNTKHLHDAIKTALVRRERLTDQFTLEDNIFYIIGYLDDLDPDTAELLTKLVDEHGTVHSNNSYGETRD